MIILASASPRRREILSELGVNFEVVVADADESSEQKDPEKLTKELSKRKAEAVREKLLKAGTLTVDCVIIAADTVVFNNGEILGKPKDAADAKAMIRSLSGKEHSVVSGVSVTVREKSFCAACTTRVRVEDIPESEIDRYVASGEPMDKAGAYGIQGKFSVWVKGIDGCYFNVVGLPVNTLAQLYFEATGERLI